MNVSIISGVHFDQKRREKVMHKGVGLDRERLQSKLNKYGIKDKSMLFREQHPWSNQKQIHNQPKIDRAKLHQPTHPDDIPELQQLGVTEDSTYVPGMRRPEIDKALLRDD